MDEGERKQESPVKPKAEQALSEISVEDGGLKPGKGKNAKPVEPSKDYVHVRARRGQATDSHSLAERVRRERINQRMKVLQDLVPGCNKVIGKSLMLDEIINYVQSLQRQVEFLSMKLATVNPLDFSNLPSLLQKDMFQACGPSASSVFSLESSSSGFPFSNQGDVFQSFLANGMENQCNLNPLDLALSQATNEQYAFQDGTPSSNLQQRNFWEEGLQGVFHIDNGQNLENGVSAQSFHGRAHENRVLIRSWSAPFPQLHSQTQDRRNLLPANKRFRLLLTATQGGARTSNQQRSLRPRIRPCRYHICPSSPSLIHGISSGIAFASVCLMSTRFICLHTPYCNSAPEAVT